MGKNPAFQFYPGDWERDLDEHSLEIEGAWIRICCKLWWSLTKGRATKTLEQWSKVLRVDPERAKAILEYLRNEGISTMYGDPSNGDSRVTVVSRRMVSDEKLRKIRSESGKLGGNPQLKKQRQIDTLQGLNNQNPTTQDNQNPTPSSSVFSLQSSSSKIKKEIIKKEKLPFGQFQNVLLTSKEKEKVSQEEIEALSEWLESSGKKKKSHYATILTWRRKNGSPPTKTQALSQKTFTLCPKCGKETTKEDLRNFESCLSCFKPIQTEKIKDFISGIGKEIK